MSVKVRKYKRGGWEVDIHGELPNGRAYRERRKSPVSSKSGSKRWGESPERELLEELSRPKTQLEESRKEVPTLGEFPVCTSLRSRTYPGKETSGGTRQPDSPRQASALPLRRLPSGRTSKNGCGEDEGACCGCASSRRLLGNKKAVTVVSVVSWLPGSFGTKLTPTTRL